VNKVNKPVLISFNKLGQLLDQQGKKWQYLREMGISPGIVDKIKRGTGHIDTRTIQDICEYMDCQPGDIMEYIGTAGKGENNVN
jgi:DNA-binding Xre family transcriptional regulator